MPHSFLIVLCTAIIAIAGPTRGSDRGVAPQPAPADDQLSRDVKTFLGDARGSYIADNELVSLQAIEVLSGPPGESGDLPGGYSLFAACRPHSCEERRAVVSGPDHRISAIAILSRHCHRVPFGQSGCERSPALDIFVERASGSELLPFMKALEAWGAAQASEELKDDTTGILVGPYQGYQIRGVRDEERELKEPRFRRIHEADIERGRENERQAVASEKDFH